MTASMVANRCKWLLRQKKYGVPGEVIPLVLQLSDSTRTGLCQHLLKPNKQQGLLSYV